MFTDGSDLKAAASTTGPLEGLDQVALAQTCVGFRDVRMTPLLAGLMAGAAVNGGRLLRPHVTRGTKTQELGRPLDDPAADHLRAMMIASATDGFAKNARIPGVEVGGKVGSGTDPGDDGWFVGFAARDGRPVVAIAVLLEKAGTGGGAEAARIGGQVMKSVIAGR
jgi:peptidoglycan glycosyltransferase